MSRLSLEPARTVTLRTMPGSSYVKVLGVAALALAGGVGVLYDSTFVFVAVAAAFVAGLWLLLRDGSPPSIDSVVMDSVVHEPASNRRRTRGEEGPRRSLVERLIPLYLLCWWVVMIAPLATYAPREVGKHAVESTVSGSLGNQILVASFGIIGMLFLPAAIKRINRAFWPIIGLWVLYLTWGYTSLFWSVYPAITFRNLVAFVLVSFGSFGFGAGFYGSRPNGVKLFARHLTVAGILSALVVLVPLPFHLDAFNPFDPGQRVEISGNFATFVSRPTMIALLTLVATSMLGLRQWRNYDWFMILFLILPALALKTRGPILWAMLSLVILYPLCRSHLRDRVFQSGLLIVLGLGMYVFYINGVLRDLVPYLTRDNAQLSMTLTGRVPLWEALWPAVERHPFLGAGFSAFWNPDNLYLMQRLVGFPVVSAHNGFLEELLNTGAIGLTLFLTFWISTMVFVASKAHRGDALGWLAFLFLVLYLFLNLTTSLMQEYLEMTFMVVFVILGLMAVNPAKRLPDTQPVTEESRTEITLVPTS